MKAEREKREALKKKLAEKREAKQEAESAEAAA
jgi:hypothetical protein